MTGGCAWQGETCGRGCASQGGVHGKRGMCGRRVGGMCGRGHAWQGACVARGHVWQGGMCERRYGHCRGQYASYWNAFLIILNLDRWLIVRDITVFVALIEKKTV